MTTPRTAERPTIEIPRLENERAERYQARVEYIVAGADRSLRDLARKLDKSLTVVGRWSSEDNWAEHAARYDETVYTLAARDAADAYRKSLLDYRDRYGKMGKLIFETSVRLLSRLNKVADTAEVGPGTLAIITNAARVAADLEALALQIEPLLENLDAVDRQ